MCLIITFAAAVISTLLWYFRFSGREYHFSMLLTMFWGASLMWIVDGLFSYMSGEGFFDLSASDAALGAVVVLAALAVWVVRLLIADPLNVIGKKLSARG